MTPEQKSRLHALVPQMVIMARRKAGNNDIRKAFAQIDALKMFLNGEPMERTAEEWLQVAESAAKGADKPGTIRMTMEQMLSGKPPEAFIERDK